MKYLAFSFVVCIILSSVGLVGASNVSINAVQLNTTSFIFATDGFIVGSVNSFNTTGDMNFTFLSTANIEKISGGGSNNIFIRILVDDVEVLTELLRATSTTGDVGAVFTTPTRFNVSAGQHNITMEWRATGNGEINVSNHDMVLIEFVSNAGNDIRVDLTNGSYSHSDTSFVDGFNFSASSSIAIDKVLVIKQTIQASLTSTVSYFVNQTVNDTQSTFWTRRQSGATDVGSAFGIYHDDALLNSTNYSLMSQTTGGTADVNITVLHFDTGDNVSNFINHVSNSNASTNISQSLSLGPGVHKINTLAMNITNGTSLLVFASISIGSATGPQIPVIMINSSNATVTNCESNKRRRLANSQDRGVGGLILVCGNLSVGETYTFDMYADVAAGETMVLFDEVILGIEAVLIDIVTLNRPPIPREITNPLNGTSFRTNDTVTWNAFSELNGENVTYNVSLLNSDGVFNQTVNVTNLTSTVFNITGLPEIEYIFVVEGCDDQLLCSNSTSAFTLDDTRPTITVLSPLNTTIRTRVVTFSVTVDEDASSVLMSLDGGVNQSLVNTSGAWVLFISGVADGSHNVTFFANDTAGNTNSSIVFWTMRFQSNHQSLIIAQVVTGTALMIGFGVLVFVLRSIPGVGVRRRFDRDDFKIIAALVVIGALLLVLVAAIFYANLTEQVVTTIGDNPTQSGIG